MHDTYYANDQANSFMDDKDQCDGKGADSSRKSMHSRQRKKAEVKHKSLPSWACDTILFRKR